MKPFSERIGAASPPASLLIGAVTVPLQNSVWNVLLTVFSKYEHWSAVAPFLARGFFKTAVDELPAQDYLKRKWVKERFYKLVWFEFFDFIEYVAANVNTINEYSPYSPRIMRDLFNRVFEQEYVGYRFVNGALAPITSPEEIQAITDALSASRSNGLGGVAIHIDAALRLLSQRPHPDYRNSVKESISAVESAARQLAPAANGNGLAAPLDELTRKHGIHGALRTGFLALYGYTSDEGGIRHALLEDSAEITFAEAQFMLVACSAFAHYLLLKAPAAS